MSTKEDTQSQSQINLSVNEIIESLQTVETEIHKWNNVNTVLRKCLLLVNQLTAQMADDKNQQGSPADSSIPTEDKK